MLQGFEVRGRGEGAGAANLAAGDEAVDGAPDADEGRRTNRPAKRARREEVSDQGAKQTNAGVSELVPYVSDGGGYFKGAELELATLAPGVPVECGEAEVDGGKAREYTSIISRGW